MQLENLDEIWSLDCANDDEDTKGSFDGFTHCLCIVPYNFSLSSIDTFAIAILPLTTSEKDSKRKSKSQKKKNNKQKGIIKPFYVDFCAPVDSTIGRRFKNIGNELLLKAVAPKKVGEGIIYDLTAGFGQDSAIMALGGASAVYMVERDPIVSTLLEDAMRRMKLVAELEDQTDDIVLRAKELCKKLKLIPGKEGEDVARILAQGKNKTIMIHEDMALPTADICYLDPMFPPRNKSAAVKKNMQILHGLLNTNSKHDMKEQQSRDIDESNLLEAALAVASRVVVKRPLKAQLLSGYNSSMINPSSQIKGNVNRWDIYTPNGI